MGITLLKYLYTSRNLKGNLIYMEPFCTKYIKIEIVQEITTNGRGP